MSRVMRLVWIGYAIVVALIWVEAVQSFAAGDVLVGCARTVLGLIGTDTLRFVDMR